MADAIRILTLAAMLGTGIIAGVFFAFSVFVMPAFAAVPRAIGVAAMRSINRVILRTVFIPVFVGTAIVGAVLIAMTLVAGAPWPIVAAGVLYIAGCFGVTVAGNVPLNNALDAAGDDAAEAVWADYVRRWTRWNHVRTAASAASCVLYGISL